MFIVKDSTKLIKNVKTIQYHELKLFSLPYCSSILHNFHELLHFHQFLHPITTHPLSNFHQLI